MAAIWKIGLSLSLFCFFFVSSSATLNTTTTPPPPPPSCSNHVFPQNTAAFASCQDLPALTSFLHWNYHSSTRLVEVAFRHTGITSPTWIAWAINPTSTAMIGSQSLVAFQRDDGTMAAYTSPITSYGTRLAAGNLSFPVYNVSATYANGEMVIYATLELPPNSTIVNHVWQTGPVSDNTPGLHPLTGPNVRSFGTLDFLSGKIATTATTTTSLTNLKYIHMGLNGIGWGTMMPIGVIMARYVKVLKPADSLWFKLHVGCQCLAYLIGVSGAITGIVLGAKSTGVQYTAHRYIGIVLFTFATLQVLSVRLRLGKDHKYRIYWTIYHMSIGYSTLILSIYNILGGLQILGVGSQWRNGYVGLLAALGFIVVVLEIYTRCFPKESKKRTVQLAIEV